MYFFQYRASETRLWRMKIENVSKLHSVHGPQPLSSWTALKLWSKNINDLFF